MARKSKRFRGSVCKTDCGGHKAGFRYGKSGGATPSPHSSSFNKGLGIANGTYNPRIAKKKRKKTP